MNKKPLILVVGDIVIDRYLYTKQTRSNPEGVAPLVDIEREEICLGGAANVARNITKLGCDCILAGNLDNSAELDDIFLDDLFEENNIRYKHLLKTEFGASVKTRVVLNGENILRLDRDNKSVITTYSTNEFANYLSQLKEPLSCVVLSDYNKGLLSETMCQLVIHFGNAKGIPVIVDPKANPKKYTGCFIMTPNKTEAVNMTGVSDPDLAATKLLDYADFVLLTKSEEGCQLFYSDTESKSFPALNSNPISTIGAGDSLVSSLAVALANGKLLFDAVDFANKSAAIAVGKSGTVFTDISEITL